VGNLFAYGTLKDPEIMIQVSGFQHRSDRATLLNYVRKKVLGEVYPAIIQQNGSVVEGILYYDVSPRAFHRLDMFEGRIYVRTDIVTTLHSGMQIPSQTYVLKASCADRLSDEAWSFETFLRNGKGIFQGTYRGFETLD